MKQIKTKKISKYLLSLFMLLAFSVCVNAKGIDTSTCKEGKKYTYYFYTAEGIEVTSSKLIENINYNNPYLSAIDYFQNYHSPKTITSSIGNIPVLYNKLSIVNILDLNTEKYNKESGIIYLDHSQSSQAYETIKGNDFWDKVKEINRGSTNYLLNNEKTTAYIVDPSVAAVTQETDALYRASFELHDYNIKESANESTLNLTIERKYDSSKANMLDYTDDNKLTNINATTITSITNGNKYWFQPVVYYIEFCQKSSASDELKDTNTGNTEIKVTRKITYDKNTTDEVTNMPENSEIAVDKADTISNVKPVRKGYTFMGWSVVSNGGFSDLYEGGESYTGTEDLNLYAIWKSNEAFTITYDADGGEDAPAAQKGKAGECVKISDVKPKKENETFLGWYLKSNPSSTDKKYVAGDEYCGENGDITLYAQYTGDTGVEEYFGAFIAVALIAGGMLVLSNKKRLFKQM